MYADVADHMRLTEAQRAETLKSGQGKADNRIGWAMSFLVRAEALTRPRRGSSVITDAGRTLLAAHPNGITEKDLQAIPAFRDYVPIERSGSTRASIASEPVETVLDPVEQIEQGIQRINADVSAQLLKRLREQDPAFLEQSVLDVLVAMGYTAAPTGRLAASAAQATVESTASLIKTSLDCSVFTCRPSVMALTIRLAVRRSRHSSVRCTDAT
jgi:restriction system protein